jgi:hypothetical protein
LRPASRFCAVVPPWRGLLPEPLDFPPRLELPGEFEIFAARLLDMPFLFRASYCLSFFTLGLFPGTAALPSKAPAVTLVP